MTECTRQLDLFSIGRRTVTATFDGTRISSDSGAILLGRLEQQMRLCDRIPAAIGDSRDPARVEHSNADLLRQRIFSSPAVTRTPPTPPRCVTIPRSSSPSAALRTRRPRWPRSRPCPGSSAAKRATVFVSRTCCSISGSSASKPRGRGCENRIKDLKCAMFGARVSCSRFADNQFRLLLHTAAYVLMFKLRERMSETAQMDTLRLKLLKIGAEIRVTARRIWVRLCASHPAAGLFELLSVRLGATATT